MRRWPHVKLYDDTRRVERRRDLGRTSRRDLPGVEPLCRSAFMDHPS